MPCLIAPGQPRVCRLQPRSFMPSHPWERAVQLSMQAPQTHGVAWTLAGNGIWPLEAESEPGILPRAAGEPGSDPLLQPSRLLFTSRPQERTQESWHLCPATQWCRGAPVPTRTRPWAPSGQLWAQGGSEDVLRRMELTPLIDASAAATGCGARSHQFDSGDGEFDLERPRHQLAFIDAIAHRQAAGLTPVLLQNTKHPSSRTRATQAPSWGSIAVARLPQEPVGTSAALMAPGLCHWVPRGHCYPQQHHSKGRGCCLVAHARPPETPDHGAGQPYLELLACSPHHAPTGKGHGLKHTEDAGRIGTIALNPLAMGVCRGATSGQGSKAGSGAQLEGWR